MTSVIFKVIELIYFAPLSHNYGESHVSIIKWYSCHYCRYLRGIEKKHNTDGWINLHSNGRVNSLTNVCRSIKEGKSAFEEKQKENRRALVRNSFP